MACSERAAMSSNLGSKRLVVGAHYGSRDWLSQRVTAALIALFTLVVLVHLLLPACDPCSSRR